MKNQTYLVPQVWRVALLGVIAGLPATAVLNWLPNAEADIGGGSMVIGAMIAGAVAVPRSVAPSAAGLRAGLLAGLLAALSFVFTDGMGITWSTNRAIFFSLAVGMLLCVSPVFGAVFGKLGGWVANSLGGAVRS